MGLYVNTNVSGLRGRNSLNNVNSQLDVTYQRLSSGLRINSAKDDAAGLAISDRMTSQINGLQQGNRNAADAIAMAQTVEGAVDELVNALQEIRTLAVQGSNGTNTEDDRKSILAQITALKDGMTKIGTDTSFGGIKVLGADAATLKMQIGANGGDTVDLALQEAADLFESTTNALATANADPTATKIGAIIGGADTSLGLLDGYRSSLGAFQNRLDSTIRNQSNVIANQSDARSRIRDTDFAEESAKLSQQNIIQQASMSMLMQANMRPQLALSLLG